MKQILQNITNGETSLEDIPAPKNVPGSLLIATRNSVVSAGTERMLVEFGKSSYLGKARQQPDKVKEVINKIKTDGLLTTIEAVRSKLDQPLPLGYCNSGVVVDSTVPGFVKGDRVVSNGGHAEVVRVPKNLCAKIPDDVDDESAAFTVLGAIGLQGIRLAEPTLGESFVVTGLGLIGLMCVQMLRANGCRVLGIDQDSARCELARKFGAQTVDLSIGEDPISIAQLFSRGRGVDGVIVTASSKSNEVMHQAAQMCRKRGRVVLVGVVGLNLRRDDFFKKEISFQVSASYGPGRYDPMYEEKGQDYPVGFVRWTEQRNFEAVLDMMSAGTLDVKSLITSRFDINDAVEAYKLLDDSSTLGIVLQYTEKNHDELLSPVVKLNRAQSEQYSVSDAVVGFIGAGNYASRTLIPAFKDAGAKMEVLVTSGGVSGVHHGRKAEFNLTTTELDVLWNNENVNTAAIVTRHDLHATQVCKALESGLNVFVEKPLALRLEELDKINRTYQEINATRESSLRVMVGFNRRFAPHIVKMKSLLREKREPKSIIITVNAGAIPADHWTQDPDVGGGRIIGEGCHFIDLMRFLVGHPITAFNAIMLGDVPGIDIRDDKVSINLSFADGSFGTIHYFANGGKAFPKERVEVFCGNAVLQMDNYRSLKGYGWPGFKSMKLFRQDKGQKACARAFIESVQKGQAAPIAYDEVLETSRVSIEVADLLRN